MTDVFALGEQDDRIWLTEYIRTEMQLLNGNLPVTTWIENEEHPGVWSEWEALRGDDARGTDERVERSSSGETVVINPRKMLADVEGLAARSANTRSSEGYALSLFVCYAHADEQLVKRLIPSLKILTNRGFIKPWRDTDLVPGEDWDETIKKRLMEAEIILYMVSRNFLASEYIRTHERPISMQLRKDGRADILPVLLKHCTYGPEDFAKFELLPFKGKTLTSYQSRDTAWELIEGALNRPLSGEDN